MWKYNPALLLQIGHRFSFIAETARSYITNLVFNNSHIFVDHEQAFAFVLDHPDVAYLKYLLY